MIEDYQPNGIFGGNTVHFVLFILSASTQWLFMLMLIKFFRSFIAF